jgi:hypothetical protein
LENNFGPGPGEISTVWEALKALSTKLLESECASRFRKEAVAKLIISGMVTSKEIAEEANGRPQNEALIELINSHRPSVWTKRGSAQCTQAGLKIESAPARAGLFVVRKDRFG